MAYKSECHLSCNIFPFSERNDNFSSTSKVTLKDDDVIKWKHFPRYWPFVRGIHRSRVNSLHKGQLRAAFVFSLICAWINVWVGQDNNGGAGDLRRHRAYYDVIVMISWDVLVVNPFPQSVAYMRQWIGSALVQIMAWRPFGAKPLAQPMLGYHQLDP